MNGSESPSFSRPTSPSRFSSLNPRKLLPLHHPPEALLLYPPFLPSESKQIRSRKTSPIHEKYSVSTHLAPAAYPRTTPYTPLPPELDLYDDSLNNLSESNLKEQRKQRAILLSDKLIALKALQSKGEIPGEERANRLLWNCLNRYLHKGRIPPGKKRISLILLHANGFPKEIWEPFILHLVSNLERDSSTVVEEIIAFEAVQHGDAFLVNQDKLGILYDWSDNARDVFNLLLNYLPPMSASEKGSPPTHLHRVSEEISQERFSRGFSDRSLVALGHSFGGCTAALAAVYAPKLFSSIVLVDPVIIPPYINRSRALYTLLSGAVRRRGVWASRDEARRLFDASPFFAAWDPDVLGVYVECGLIPVVRNGEEVGVRLKMPGLQEGVVFAENRTSYEAFELMGELNESIKLHFVMPGENRAVAGSEDAARDLVWRRPSNCSNVRIMSAGHLIVQEAPKELAREVSVFLAKTFSQAAEINSRARL